MKEVTEDDYHINNEKEMKIQDVKEYHQLI
jgi:hypothetical protein